MLFSESCAASQAELAEQDAEQGPCSAGWRFPGGAYRASTDRAGQASFNVAVAGSLIMYDRLRKRTELARRVGGDVGGQSRLQAERTAPRLR